mmetsp:Transcript_6132/g.18308  ORF Transcript_6132/g.18308 Transcript_6132/m.18308 type:complete len:205 (-) Transcript_6132:833-1447(-)
MAPAATCAPAAAGSWPRLTASAETSCPSTKTTLSERLKLPGPGPPAVGGVSTLLDEEALNGPGVCALLEPGVSTGAGSSNAAAASAIVVTASWLCWALGPGGDPRCASALASTATQNTVAGCVTRTAQRAACSSTWCANGYRISNLGTSRGGTAASTRFTAPLRSRMALVTWMSYSMAAAFSREGRSSSSSSWSGAVSWSVVTV